jgi:methionyl-tRNA formyltransferase
MKIGYFADGPWSHEAIKLISETDGLVISFIVPRYDTQDPFLKEWAINHNIPFIPAENVNSPDFLELVSQYDVDLLVSMSFNQILKSPILKLSKHGFINCHAGALPFYRGRNPLNWAIINGEKEFGITVHYVDEGIDTGDIIKQEMFPITETDTYASLLRLAIKECANVLYAAIVEISTEKSDRIVQDSIHTVGTYFGIRTYGDENLSLNQPARNVFNFIRAITLPGPCARCLIENQEFAIVTAEMIPEAPIYIATVGEVLGRNERGIVVKVNDSTLLVTSTAKVINGVVGEPFTPRFRIGTRLKDI